MPLLRVMAGSRSFGALLAADACLLRAADPHGCLLVDHGRVGPLSGEMVRGERCQRHLRRCLQDTDHPDHPRHGVYGRLAALRHRRVGRPPGAGALLRARAWDAFVSAVCLCAGGIIAFSPLLIRLLAAESYYDAWRYIPILTLSMIAAAFSNFMGSVYVVTKKSTASLWISLAGAQTVFQRK